jgi:hypothetical protein
MGYQSISEYLGWEKRCHKRLKQTTVQLLQKETWHSCHGSLSCHVTGSIQYLILVKCEWSAKVLVARYFEKVPALLSFQPPQELH